MDYILYDYFDEKGVFLYQTVKTTNPKSFKYRRWDNKTKQWIWSLEGVRRVLYNFETMLKSDYVFVVEGEKDVDTLREYGFVATTCPCGSNSWQSEFNKYFKDKLVYIIPDNDPPGLKFAKTVAYNIFKYAYLTHIITLPGLKEKGDVSDWLGSYTLQELERLCLSADSVKEEEVVMFEIEINKKKTLRTNPINTNGLPVRGDIDTARAYPIENILETDMHGRAICINPDHKDEIPSMDVRNGFCYCYACGFHADVIKVAQMIWKCSFPEAIKILNILSCMKTS